MSNSPEISLDQSLLSAEHQLTDEERERLENLGGRGWLQVLELVNLRAKATYSVQDARTFALCVGQHMDDEDQADMIVAEVYNCPQCSTLLKDRKSSVASSILLERHRIAMLWLDVEQAKFEEFDTKLDRFRRALGLPQ